MDCLRQIVGREFGKTKKLKKDDFSPEEYAERRKTTTERYREINIAVAAGVATDHQKQLHTLKATTHKAWRSLQDLRNELKEKDPEAFKQLKNAETEAKKCHL